MEAPSAVEGALWANKFFGEMFNAWSPPQKLQFCQTNIALRGKLQEIILVANINFLSDFWEMAFEDDATMTFVIKNLKDEDSPELQQFSSKQTAALAMHSQNTVQGMRSYTKQTGRKHSMDDWNPFKMSKEYCNNTDFIVMNHDLFKEVKLDTVSCMALFEVRMTAEHSPAFGYLNTTADELVLAFGSVETLRSKFEEDLKRVLAMIPEVILVLECTVRYPYKQFTDVMKPENVFTQGVIFHARSHSIKEIEDAQVEKDAQVESQTPRPSALDAINKGCEGEPAPETPTL